MDGVPVARSRPNKANGTPAGADVYLRSTRRIAPDVAAGAIYTRVADTVYHSIRDHTDALFERAYPIFH